MKAFSIRLFRIKLGDFIARVLYLTESFWVYNIKTTSKWIFVFAICSKWFVNVLICLIEDLSQEFDLARNKKTTYQVTAGDRRM